MLFRRFVAYLCASVFTGDCQHPGCRDSLECTQQQKQENEQVTATVVAVKPASTEVTFASAATVVAVANNHKKNNNYKNSVVSAMSPCKNVEVKVREMEETDAACESRDSSYC